ncbi:unnamed protein product [Dracunculus medinensis]|uniref:ShKT domain-containing protein n=1 Tax=Dracunculus medinensis TaxID=318479 RepID=A0A0N4UBA7_DRAME|nr:unnamed protein product [Dracunculus medinensis]
MLPLVFFFISLIHIVNSGGVQIVTCAVTVGAVQRPSVHAQRCTNRDDRVNYLVSDLCENPTLRNLALRECSSHCAFCCKTKQFDCPNAAGAEGACQRLYNEGSLCSDQRLNDIALRRCPHTCGLCDRPGALGACPDQDEYCAIRLLGDPTCSTDFMKKLCKKTCNLRDCLPENNSTIQSKTCFDSDSRCRENAKYCFIGEYGKVMSRVCRLTCGYCRP